jgi:hypothetical protein
MKPSLPTIADPKIPAPLCAVELIRLSPVKRSLQVLRLCVLAFRLRQRELEILIKPDFNWQLIEAWRAFLSTLDRK